MASVMKVVVIAMMVGMDQIVNIKNVIFVALNTVNAIMVHAIARMDGWVNIVH